MAIEVSVRSECEPGAGFVTGDGLEPLELQPVIANRKIEVRKLSNWKYLFNDAIASI